MVQGNFTDSPKGRHRYGKMAASAQPARTRGVRAGFDRVVETVKSVLAQFTREEITEAMKKEKAFRKYAQKLSEEYHVQMKESRIASLRAAHRARTMSEDDYHKELKALMKTRPGDLDILEEIHFA